MQGGVKNYLGNQKMVNAPLKWRSGPQHPSTELAYITKKEKDALNILCRGAALRYLLTRIYDYLNTPKGTLIKIKDPNEYFQKLIFHNNLNSYKDYYK